LVCRFSCILLDLQFFLLLDDLLELFLAFGLQAVLHGVLASNFKLCAFVVNGLIKGEIEKPSGQCLGLKCNESLTCQGLNLNPGHFRGSILPLCSCGESRLLVSWRAGDRCGMTCNDEDHGRSRRPDAEDRGWSHKSDTRWPSDREVRWRYVQSVPCTWRRGAWVSWLSLKTKVDSLSVVWPQNHWDGLLVVWAQNRWRWFSSVWPQNRW
jgi:hypothetical protein